MEAESIWFLLVRVSSDVPRILYTNVFLTNVTNQIWSSVLICAIHELTVNTRRHQRFVRIIPNWRFSKTDILLTIYRYQVSTLVQFKILVYLFVLPPIQATVVGADSCSLKNSASQCGCQPSEQPRWTSCGYSKDWNLHSLNGESDCLWSSLSYIFSIKAVTHWSSLTGREAEAYPKAGRLTVWETEDTNHCHDLKYQQAAKLRSILFFS